MHRLIGTTMVRGARFVLVSFLGFQTFVRHTLKVAVQARLTEAVAARRKRSRPWQPRLVSGRRLGPGGRCRW